MPSPMLQPPIEVKYWSQAAEGILARPTSESASETYGTGKSEPETGSVSREPARTPRMLAPSMSKSHREPAYPTRTGVVAACNRN